MKLRAAIHDMALLIAAITVAAACNSETSATDQPAENDTSTTPPEDDCGSQPPLEPADEPAAPFALVEIFTSEG